MRYASLWRYDARVVHRLTLLLLPEQARKGSPGPVPGFLSGLFALRHPFHLWSSHAADPYRQGWYEVLQPANLLCRQIRPFVCERTEA